MGSIGKTLDELDSRMIAEVDRWADRAERVGVELVQAVGGPNGFVPKAEARLGDDFGGFSVKARRHASRAGAALDRAATDAHTELERDAQRVGVFLGEVVGKARADLWPYGTELLRELDVLLGNMHARIRAELSRRAPYPTLAT